MMILGLLWLGACRTVSNPPHDAMAELAGSGAPVLKPLTLIPFDDARASHLWCTHGARALSVPDPQASDKEVER
jgi:hypothetical protein